ncbi:MAG: formate dehydrogenase subunit alpha [Syntrophobacteraceae bacterium]
MTQPEMVMTTCPFCGTGCNFYLQVLDGEILDIVPSRTHAVSEGQLCVLGRNAHRFVQNKDRLTRPLMRQGERFVEISWEEAYRRVAEGLLGIKERHGADSLGVLASAKCTNEENFAIMKLARSVLATRNVDHCARLCHASTVVGLAASFGSGAMTNSIDEIQDTDCMLVMGSNTTSQHPIIASKMMRAKERGARLIVIDPRRIPLTEYADLFLRIKPGSNVALINGMIHILIQKGLIDRAFIEERTEGFEEVRQKVREYPSERVNEITGVSPELLEKAAVMYGEADKSMIFYAMGITQHSTGTDQVKAMGNLAMVTGNLGKPSTGVNPLRGQNNVQGACDMGALPNVLSGYQAVTDPESRQKFEAAWGCALPDGPGLTVVEMTNAAVAGDLKGMFIVGENPMVCDPDINHVREGLQKLELLVVQDIFLTETAQLAHIVLPAASFAEKDGTFTNTDRRVQRVRKAIEPVGEAKADWQIIAELARALGAGGFNYTSPKDIMEEIASLTPSYGGISYERLDAGEVLHWPCPTADHPGTPILHRERFVRGKGRFFPVDHTPAVEQPDSEFPYLLSTGRVPFHFHGGSMTRRIEKLDREVPTGFAEMNPADADELKVAQGEMIRLISRRGAITLAARVSDVVEPGVLFVPMHFAECAANMLTDTHLDNDAKIPPLKVCAVRVEKPAQAA